MTSPQRLLALLEVYDDAIEELYVLGDHVYVDLILRLERRRKEVAALLDPSIQHAATIVPAPRLA